MGIMVTGGTGNIGSALVRYLVLEQGLEGTVVFDRYVNTSRIEDVLDRVTVVQGDVLDAHDLHRAIRRYDVERIVHLAFLMGTGNPNADTAVPYLRTLTEGTANVFEAARVNGIKRVAFASSAAVFGNPGDHGKARHVQAVEDDPKRPRHTYGWSKLWGEGVAEWFNDTHAMEILSLRICHTFGNGGPNSPAAGLSTRPQPAWTMAPELFEAGLPVRVPPEDRVIDVLYIKDTAQAFHLAATAPLPEHRAFNLRAEQRPVGDFTRHLRQLYPDAEIDVAGPEFPGELQLMDNTRLVEELGFQPRYTLESALDEYAETARERVRVPA
jgi:UDP-glucose 4-epimerase